MNASSGRHVIRWMSALCALFLTVETRAQDAPLNVLEQLGRAVEVRQYPVELGLPHTFIQRRRDAATVAVNDAQRTLETPLLKVAYDETDIRLVYPNRLVAITGRYSNGIICRVDVSVTGLREGFSEKNITELAARSCGATERENWGASGLDVISPIGTEPMPDVNGAQGRIYATEQIYSLFPQLVREVEVQSGLRSSLVQEDYRTVTSSDESNSQWQYAWFENGDILAVRHQPTSSRVFGQRKVDLVCAILTPGESLISLERGSFADWCDDQIGRLAPGLEKYVEAVVNFRRSAAEKRSHPGDPSVYPGFHSELLPAQLTEQFWRTGQVTASEP